MSKLIKEVASGLLPFLVSLLRQQDGLLSWSLNTMHNYMIIRSHGRKQWWIEELVSIEIGFIRPNGDTYIQGKLDLTTLTYHDVEHLIFGVGYTPAEEFEVIGYLGNRLARNSIYKCYINTFSGLVNKINKSGGDYKVTIVDSRLVVEQI